MEFGAKGQDGPGRLSTSLGQTVTARCGPVMFCRRWRFWPQQILIAF